MKVFASFLALLLAGGWYASAQNFAMYGNVPVARLSFLRNPCGTPNHNCFGDPTLVGYWPLTEATDKAYDFSGNGNHGTWSGTKAGTNGYYAAGKIGAWAGTFSGATSINLGPRSSYTAATILAWIRQTGASQSASSYIVALTGSQNNLDLGTGSNVLYAIVYPATGSNLTDGSSYNIYDGNWHLVATSYTGSVLSLYRDGLLVSSRNVSAASIGGGAAWIGSNNATSSYFPGMMNGVRLYSRALSQAEIQAIYNAENH